MMDKDLKMWIDEQIILYRVLWNKAMYKIAVDREDEYWLNRKLKDFEEYIKDLEDETFPLEALNPKKYLASYVDDIKNKYIEIQMRTIAEEKEYVKKRIEERYGKR